MLCMSSLPETCAYAVVGLNESVCKVSGSKTTLTWNGEACHLPAFLAHLRMVFARISSILALSLCFHWSFTRLYQRQLLIRYHPPIVDFHGPVGDLVSHGLMSQSNTSRTRIVGPSASITMKSNDMFSIYIKTVRLKFQAPIRTTRQEAVAPSMPQHNTFKAVWCFRCPPLWWAREASPLLVH